MKSCIPEYKVLIFLGTYVQEWHKSQQFKLVMIENPIEYKIEENNDVIDNELIKWVYINSLQFHCLELNAVTGSKSGSDVISLYKVAR